jgi:hypothetical protein
VFTVRARWNPAGANRKQDSMSARELILLSPYRLPAQNPLMLGNEDVAAFLNAYTVLWHPALLHGAVGPPRLASPYDHEQPTAGHVYAVPESPPLILPDDWDDRVRDIGAVAFRATGERDFTLDNLKEALTRSPNSQPAETAEPAVNLWDVGPEVVAAFFGLGFGYLMIDTLFEAMEHDRSLAASEFWGDVCQAVAALQGPDAGAYRRHLQSAADRLLAAREVLYPVSVHLVDLCLLDEQRLAEPLPASVELGLPCNLLAAAAVLEKLGREQPERLATVRERLHADHLEVCGGPYVEREDALLPVPSQVWNFLKGQATYKALLDREVRVFARKRFGAHPQLPLLLNHVGLRRAVLLAFDEAVVPSYRSCPVTWSSPDGKQVDAFTRAPHAADNPQTFFHWAHYLHKTIMQDHAATLALLHSGAQAGPWYGDLLELSRFAPVLGQWTTLSRYFDNVLTGEYASPPAADEFHGDYLSDRCNAHRPHSVSGFAQHARLRRRLDTAWTLAALHRGLAGRNDQLALNERLAELEDRIETSEADPGPDLAVAEQQAAEALAERLQARAAPDTPGFLVLNPCSFARRVALELDGFTGPPPLGGPLRAAQVDGGRARLVVEVPALGFAWIPRTAAPGLPPPARMRLADPRGVRNEFFEAEVDPTTGGLRGLRDHRNRISRLGQQLVWNPGSTMRVRDVQVTSTGPALGEVITEGTLVDVDEKVLAGFRQRFRAWLGRPVLDLHIELYPEKPSDGFPWYGYYGARFAWRDERATLLRGVNGTGYVTSTNRPETPDYLELRQGHQSTVLLPGGLPFHQRHGTRMLDVILLPEGETARAFDLALALDRNEPMQTALGMVTPVPVVPTAKGPPHIGATGWLFHLDASNLLLNGVRPAAGGADAVIAHLLECGIQGGQAEFRCVRDPKRAVLLDGQGTSVLEASLKGDAAVFDVAAGDLAQLRVEFE